MQNFAARAHDARRPDIAPVHHRRGADDEQQIRAICQQFIERPRHRLLIVMAAHRCQQGASQSGHPLVGDRDGLVGDTIFEARQFRHHQPDLQMLEWMQPDGGAALPHQCFRHRQDFAGHRQRHNLDRRHQVLQRHHRIVRQRANGQRFVDRVQPVDRGRVDPQQARNLSRQVDPPRRRARPSNQRRNQGRGQAVGGDVFRDIAGFELGANDLDPPRGP